MRWAIHAAGDPPGDVTEATGAHGVLRLDDLGRLAGGAPPGGTLPEAIAVCGSDHDLAVAALTLGPDGPPLAYIPTGESDLLRMFALDRSAMLHRLHTGEPYEVDLGVIELRGVTHPFVGSVKAQPNAFRRRFGASATVRIVTDRRTHTVEAWSLFVANAQHAGGETIAPRAALMDQAMDVIAIGGPPRARSMLRRQLRRGLHLRSQHVFRRSAARFTVDVPAGWTVAVDGIRVGYGGFETHLIGAAFHLWI